MIIRSLKLVHFRGVRELVVRELLGMGATGVDLPEGVDPGVLSDAVRYAVLGRLGTDGAVIVDDSGYAYVELGFEVAGALVSIFRGVDRRGASQVSLREEGGLRVTGGEDSVSARLSELLGASPEQWVTATCLDVDTDPDREPGVLGRDDDGAMTTPAPQSLSVTDLAEARDRVETQIADLRRAERCSSLRARASHRLGDLVDLGARIRRSRSDVGLEVDRVQASRDRVRTRLRRLNEYRDRRGVLEREASRGGKATADKGSKPSAIVEWSLALCTAGWLGALIWIATDKSSALARDRVLQPAIGLGFLASAAIFLFVAQRRRGAGGRFIVSASDTVDGELVTEPVPSAPDPDRIAALRAQYSDLGDPDAPELISDLRARLAAADAELSPLHTRLERLDDLLSVFEVELGRAARALHLPVPGPKLAEEPLHPDDALDAVEARVTSLGDQVFQTCAEREALLTTGDQDVEEAQEALESELDRLGGTLGQSDLRAHVLRDRLETREDTRTVTATDDEDDAFWDEAVTRLDQRLLAVDDERSDEASGATLHDLADLSAGALREVRATIEGPSEYRTKDGDWKRWSDLPRAVRRRVRLGLAVREAGEVLDARMEGGVPPRTVVLADVYAEDFSSPEAILLGLQRIRPELASLLHPAADADAEEDDELDGGEDALATDEIPTRAIEPDELATDEIGDADGVDDPSA